MSKIISTTIVNPNGKEDTCALVQVNGQELYYLLRPIEVIGRYTISFWIKAQANETVVVHYGEQTKSANVTTSWQRVIFSFNAEHIDNVMIQFTTGNYYIYNTQLENGDVATDYNISPDDMEKQFADLETYVSKQYSEVVQSLNSYKVEVGRTYATKDSVNKDISKLTLDLNGFKTEVSKTYTTQTDFQTQIDNLQQQIDGAVETFSGSEVPTLTNKPAVDWTTDVIKDTHVGDLYVVSAENAEYGGFYYRFEKVNGVYQWTLLADSEVTKALEEARKANEKAEKAQKELDALKSNLETNYSTTVEVESAIEQSASSILQTVSGTYATQESVEASLELKVGVNDNDKVVSMINASADEINLKSNRFSLESDNTTIDKDGYIKTVGGNIGGWEIVKDGISSTTQDELGNIYRTKLYPSTPIINTPLLTCEISTDGGNTFEEYLALYPGGRIKGKQIFTTIIKPSDKAAYDAITIDSEFVEVKGELYAKKVTTSSGADLDKLNKSAPKLAAASNFTSSVTTKTFNVSAGDELIFIGSGSGSTRVLVRIFSTSAFFYESGTTILTGTPVSTFTLSGSGISLTLKNGVLTVTRGGAWSDIHYMHYHIG